MDDTAIPGIAAADVADRLRAAGCVFAEDEARLLIAAAVADAGPAGDAAGVLTRLTERRAAGLPLEHAVGWAEFCGLRIAVAPGVFVPRRRTEFLVARAAAAARATAGRPVVVDLCCGSGALGVALAAALGDVSLHAADADPAAVACARRNVTTAGGRVYQGDLFAPLPEELRGRVTVLLANVPYVPTGEIPLLPAEARDHEPRLALDGGPDGLDVLRRVAAQAPRWLAPGGCLLSEVSERQAARARSAVAAAGLTAALASDDELGATIVTGTRPADPG
jgi:release factor glutamine methyltransferase